MENDIIHQSLDFRNTLMEQNEDCLDYIQEFKLVNGSLFARMFEGVRHERR